MMRNLYRLSLFSSFFLLAGLFCTGVAYAKDFSADYVVDYTLNPDTGQTHVTQHITLTNQAPNLRASSYSLTLDHDGYQNLRAADSSGTLSYKETKNDDGTPTLTFTFNDRVVGVGNKLKWTINYDSPTLAQHHGQVWDITIPRVKEHPSYDIASYNVNLHVPRSAGAEAYVSPGPSSTAHTDTDYSYTFTKEQVLPVGIVAAFGEAQVFQFTLTYHLQNPNLGQASTEIALPPDEQPYQQIIYNKLDPQPISLRTDGDGNTLATYYLKSKQKMDVTFTGWARRYGAHPNLGSKKTVADIPASIVKQYTGEHKYWEVSDQQLIKKVKEITDPKKPAVDNARAIYQFVTTNLQYNTARINKDLKRLGASAAYRDPKNAVCMEFTDLFVTMSRIAGIPAREVDGYAYTTDSANHPIYYPGLGSDILHAWAEVYLPDAGWVPVDPTWGSTTGGIDFFGRLDLNRISFVLKGLNSETPYAAGSYKTNSSQDGDVKVSFAKEDKQGSPTLTIDLGGTNAVAGFGSSLPVKLANTGDVAVYQAHVQGDINSPGLVRRVNNGSYDRIVPGQIVSSTLLVGSPSWMTKASLPLTITAHTKSFEGKDLSFDQKKTVELAPFFLNAAVPVATTIVLVLAVLGGCWYGLHTLYERNRAKAKRLAEQAPVVQTDPLPPIG